MARVLFSKKGYAFFSITFVRIMLSGLATYYRTFAFLE